MRQVQTETSLYCSYTLKMKTYLLYISIELVGEENGETMMNRCFGGGRGSTPALVFTNHYAMCFSPSVHQGSLVTTFPGFNKYNPSDTILEGCFDRGDRKAFHQFLMNVPLISPPITF